MAKIRPEDYIEQLKTTKKAANNLKSSILQYDKTAAKYVKVIEAATKNGTAKIDSTTTELNSRLLNESEAFKKSASNEKAIIELIRKNAKSQYNRFSTTYNAAMNKRSGVEVKNAKINKLSNEASTNASNISKLNTRANKDKTEISEHLQTARKNNKDISDIHTEAERISEEIEDTYGITLDTTMAGTLVERRDTLKNRTKTWERLYLGSIAAIAIAIFAILLFNRDVSFIDVVTERLVFVTPLVVVAFVLGRQFTHERKLYEEYAFKAAAAQSLRGYTLLLNSQFRDLPDARLDILKFVVNAMNGIYDREPLTQNPSSFYLMFGNKAAKFETKLEEKIVNATKAALDEAKITNNT